MGIVYTILNRTSRKVYVGQTWESLYVRWGRHKSKALHNETSCRHLYAAIRKYGVDDFSVQTRARADTQETLDELERYWIEVLHADDREFGYNLKSGGSAGRHSAETRTRMSETRKGHSNAGAFPKGVLSAPKPFLSGHRPWNIGIPCAPETKIKISTSRKGMKQSSEVTKRRLAASHLARFLRSVAWG